MKSLLLCLFHFSWFPLLAAGDPENNQQPVATQDLASLQKVKTQNLASLSHDTSIGKTEVSSVAFAANSGAASKSNTAVHAVSRAKEEFKDMFAGSDLSNVNYMEAELNPLAISFVQDYMGKNTHNLEKMKDWGKPYFDMIDEVFTRYGIPHEMKYLAVIESNLKSGTRSWAGAAGPWQFIPSTARLMGLKVNSKVDERLDYSKSTHAAAKYIKDLHRQLGDWLLVVAAYNSGPGRVRSAIRRSGTDNFWKMQNHLPLESRNHVKKFIATHYIMEGKGGVTTLTRKEAEALAEASEVELKAVPKVDNTRVQGVSGRYRAEVIAKVLEMELDEFKKMNPDFNKKIAEGKTYEMNLPQEKMDAFNAYKYQILSESVQMALNRVGK